MEGIIIPQNRIIEVESYSTSSSIIEVLYDVSDRPFIDIALKQYLIDQGCTWLAIIEPEPITINANPFNR